MTIQSQLQGVSRGVEYLHDQGVVHSDLKAVRDIFFFVTVKKTIKYDCHPG